MRRRLAERGLADQVDVASAGILARPGAPVWPPVGRWAEAAGLDLTHFSSRRLTPAMATGADLVLAATRALRDEVIATAPAVLRRTFTWRELAWLLDGVGPTDLAGQLAGQRLRSLPALAAARRGRRAAPPGEAFDVVDPVDREPQQLIIAAEQIDTAVTAVVDLLAV